jgi:outer membrane protein TolC
MVSRFLCNPLAVLAAAVLLVPCAWAAEPLTLAEAVGLAVARSEQLAANAAAASAGRRMAQAAGQLPDPVLKLGIDNLPVNGPDRFSLTNDFMTMRRIGLMQEVPGLDKRRLRAQRAAQDVLRLQAQGAMLAINARRETALAWIDRSYALQVRELLFKQLEETRLQVEAAQVAFSGGRGTQADLLAARSAVSLLQDRLDQNQLQARNAAVLLARWIGADARRVPAGTPDWSTTELDRGITQEHLEGHPEAALAAVAIDAARLDVELARANLRPDWTVEASYSQRGPAYSNMVSIGVSVPLQLDRANRQDQEVAARLALADEAAARYQDILRNEEAEVSVLLNDWRNGKQRVDRYADDLLPLAQQRSAATLAAYRGGKADLAAVLAGRREELDLHIQALAAELETARLWARLTYINLAHDAPAATGSQP